MRSILEIALLITNFLNKEKIKYAIVGGFAVSTWGEPRSTVDVDIIILLHAEEIHKFVNFLKSNDFTVSEEDIKQSLQEKTHFTVFDEKSSFLLDIKGVYDEFDGLTLEKRIPVKIDNVTIYVASPEDTVVNKIRFGSERDLIDAETILVRRGNSLNFNYIASICERMRILKDYNTLMKRIKIKLSEEGK
jgi:hypothetical protein